jgi:hypothetical protein
MENELGRGIMLRNCLLLLGFLGALLSFAFAEDKPPVLTNADLAK